MTELHEALETVRNENQFAVDYMSELHEHFSSDQIKEKQFNVNLLDNILEHFNY